MIDPKNFTDYNRTRGELEEVLLFSIAVAGKTAESTARYLEDFLSLNRKEFETPFETLGRLKRLGRLSEAIKNSSLGKHTILSKSFSELVDRRLNLRTCKLSDLLEIHGIGPKTARMFLLHTRKNQNYAVLDVHILAYLRDQGVDAPKQTPTSKKRYETLEAKFLTLAKESGHTVADFDLQIWNQRSRKLTNN